MQLPGNSKKGSALVEAAMIWPLIFLAVVFIISMMFLLYNQAVVSASLHTGLRQAAGQWTETVKENGEQEVSSRNFEEAVKQDFLEKAETCGPLFQTGDLEAGFQFMPVYSQCSLTYTTDYTGGTMAGRSRRKAQTSTIFAVDEAQLIRNYRYAAELWERKRV